jgi:DNA-directed RNA polymerase alpha subunit
MTREDRIQIMAAIILGGGCCTNHQAALAQALNIETEYMAANAEQPWWGDFDLSVRAENALTCSGIKSLTHLANHSVRDIRRMKNIGKATLVEIRALLASHGLSLRGEGTDAEQQ